MWMGRCLTHGVVPGRLRGAQGGIEISQHVKKGAVRRTRRFFFPIVTDGVYVG